MASSMVTLVPRNCSPARSRRFRGAKRSTQSTARAGRGSPATRGQPQPACPGEDLLHVEAVADEVEPKRLITGEQRVEALDDFPRRETRFCSSTMPRCDAMQARRVEGRPRAR